MSGAAQMATSTTRPAGRNWSLPNVLTYARVAAVPLVAGFMFWPERALGALDGAGDFCRRGRHRLLRRLSRARLGAAVLARADAGPDRRQASRLRGNSDAGRQPDDLRRDALGGDRHPVPRDPRFGLREYLAELRVPMPVTAVAKWKTAAQLVALGFLIVGPSGEAIVPGSIEDRNRVVVDRRDPDALHRLGLHEGELRQCRQRLRRHESGLFRLGARAGRQEPRKN